MSDYFGWSDPSPKTTDAMRLEQAAHRFSEKHGTHAVNAVVHVSQVPVTMPLACAGMTVTAAAWAARNNVYLAIEEAAA